MLRESDVVSMTVREKEKDQKLWKRFILNISMVIILFILGMFLGVMMRNNHLIKNQILSRTRAYFQNIVLTRSWNALYGGVFVEKKDGMKSNPYLENPDIHTVDGKVYTKKNPALMTREISEMADREGLFRFHITSLNPLNPNNKADPFETQSLKMFNLGEKENSITVKEKNKSFFRYMAPLLVKASCLNCHAKQGYKIGDIRGGISVTMDVTDTRKTVQFQNFVITALSILTAVFLLGIIFFFVRKLNRRLSEAYERIEVMAMVDDLTGLYNRRYFFDRLKVEFLRARRHRHQLGFILMDLDHFKLVNDTYGHPAGDLVLKAVADTVKKSCRETDIIARYGGEEIVVLLPRAGKSDASRVAEKIRTQVAQIAIELDEGITVIITASFGISGGSPAQLMEMEDYLDLLNEADKALYQAKADGRNRVVSL